MKVKFSLKNLSKIRIEIKLGMTGPARLTISAGPGHYRPRFLRAGPEDFTLLYAYFLAVIRLNFVQCSIRTIYVNLCHNLDSVKPLR